MSKVKAPTCWMCGKIPKFWEVPAHKHFCSDDCFDKFKNGEKPMSDTKTKVPSRTRKGKFHTVTNKNGVYSCSCERWTQTSPRKDCDHIKSIKTGKPLQSKEKEMKAKKAARKNRKSITEAPTSRGILISLLTKQKNKLVAMKAIYAQVKKVKGWDDDDRVAKKVKAAMSSVKTWAKQHDFTLVQSSNGLKLQEQ